MINPIGAAPQRMYSKKDVIAKAMEYMKGEVNRMSGRQLTAAEIKKIEEVASAVSLEILGEMKKT